MRLLRNVGVGGADDVIMMCVSGVRPEAEALLRGLGTRTHTHTHTCPNL